MIIGPHGNSKKRASYARTMPSTLKKLKSAAQDLTPKFAVSEVLAGTGGLTKASSVGSLPRNRQQVANLRRHTDSAALFKMGKTKDPLFAVMTMCKEGEGKRTDDHFVRIVTGAPEPMAVLSFTWSLDDLERFCTGSNHVVLCVDPTFNLGDFFVTVTTYRHLMLTNSSGEHPVMMGPLFVHQCKRFSTYHFFASSLVGLRPSLSNIRSIGTDGEVALVNAFKTVFTQAQSLRCFLHFKSNLDEKLRKLTVPRFVRVDILRDVFGNPEEFEEGLVDVEDEQCLQASLLSLKDVWDDKESPYNDPPEFHDWFVKNCKETVRSSMLKPVRIRACLGNPPKPFYTNDVESHNNVIKQHTNYTAQELPQFVQKMKTLITTQKKEIERAVIGMGEYQVSSQFEKFAVDARKFFQMTESQREMSLQRFFRAQLCPPPPSSEDETEFDQDNPLAQCNLPEYLAEKIWKESRDLISCDSNVCRSPGSTNGEWLVKSSTSSQTRPFFVVQKESGQVVCEPSCVAYHSCGVCAHSVTIAEKTSSLDKLIQWLQNRAGVNLTRLAKSGLPRAGKKPQSKRKFSRKSSTKKIKKLVEGSTPDSLRPRTGVTTTLSGSGISTDEQDVISPSVRQDGPFDTDPLDWLSSPSDNPLVMSSTDPLQESHTTAGNMPYISDSPQMMSSGSTVMRAGSGLSCSNSPLVRTPPPLIRAPVQVNMPVMYSPMFFEEQRAPIVQQEALSPFVLLFVKGNISKCSGCGQKDLRDSCGKPHPPPNDLCLQHKEYVIFENPNTKQKQQSRDLRNVYYHARKLCIFKKYPDLRVIVPSDTKLKLTTAHMQHILQEFGLNILNSS